MSNADADTGYGAGLLTGFFIGACTAAYVLWPQDTGTGDGGETIYKDADCEIIRT